MSGLINQKGFNDADLVDFLRSLRNAAQVVSGTLPNLAPAAAPQNIKSNDIMSCIVDGTPVMVAVAATLYTIGASDFPVLTSAQSLAVLVVINSAGTVSVVPGPVVAGTVSDTILTVPLPVRPAARAVLGYLLFKGVAFTPATTALTAGMINDGDPYLIPGVQVASGTVGLVS